MSHAVKSDVDQSFSMNVGGPSARRSRGASSVDDTASSNEGGASKERFSPLIYPAPKLVRQSLHLSTRQSSRQSANRAHQTMNQSHRPLSTQPSLAIADPDTMPSILDWFTIFNYLSVETNLPPLVLIAAERVLDNFFFESAALRLTICAIAAFMQFPRLSSKKCAEYFIRAKRAVLVVSGEEASLKNLKAVLLFSQFALASGQPVVGEPFFIRAVQMLRDLRMDIDPDFSPWLAPLNLSEYDKEERRIIFWNIYYSLKLVQIAASQRSHLSLDCSNMKLLQPQPILNARFSHSQYMPAKHSTFNQTVICHLSAILDLVQLAKAHYQNAPLNALEIIIPSTWSALSQRLNTMQQTTLRHLTVSVADNNLASVVSTISATTPQQLATSTDATLLLPIISVSLLYHAATCILHRPQLYLAAQLDLMSPTFSFPETLSTLQTAVQKCIASAQTIATLNSALTHTDRTDFDSIRFDPFTSFVLFEAAIVLWFSTVHGLAPLWVPGGVLSVYERRGVRGQVLDLLKALKEVEEMMSSPPAVDVDGTGFSAPPRANMVTPLVKCVAAMVEDMHRLELQNGSNAVLPAVSMDVLMGDVVVGMAVVSLEEADGEGQRDAVCSEEPWAYLGLLGVKCGKFWWHASYEEKWRRFWEQVRNVRLVYLHNAYDRSKLDSFYNQILVPAFARFPEELDDIVVFHEQLSTINSNLSREYTLFVILAESADDGSILAAICTEYYIRSNSGLITYIATNPQFNTKGMGLGKVLLDAAVQAIKLEAHDQGHINGPAAIYCETNTDSVDAAVDVMVPARRRAVLHGLGFRFLEFEYVQPALGEGQEPCRTLCLGVLEQFLEKGGCDGSGVLVSGRLRMFLEDFFGVLMGTEGFLMDADAVRQIEWLREHSFVKVLPGPVVNGGSAEIKNARQ
ncbi:hypothetical protein HDU81_000714 [Chytriomyces hyalinus]|nr:hypothetical protein HDU81_000714 [Chytriomyces hyalinus]